MPCDSFTASRADASSSNALSSSKEPSTNFVFPARRRQTSSFQLVRAPSRAALRVSDSKLPPPGQSAREKPRTTKSVGSRPRLARSYTAGINFLRDRSPPMPKITSAHGSGTRGSRRSAGSRSGFVRLAPYSLCFGATAAGVGARLRAAGFLAALSAAAASVASLTCAGSRLDRVELGAHTLGQLGVRVLELLHAFRLEHLDDVVVPDPQRVEIAENLTCVVVGARDGVGADLALRRRR